MYVETYVLSFLAYLVITRTSLGMSLFLKVLTTIWFALFAVMQVFIYTQNNDWRHLVQATLWTFIALNTYLVKPIDKRGFWRDFREMAFPLFDFLVVIIFLFGVGGVYGWAETLQMTQPIVEKVLVAEGARGKEEVAERLAHLCPRGIFTETLWSGTLYSKCDYIIEWDEFTQVYLTVRKGADPDENWVASATVGFDNETGEVSFIKRGKP